MLVLLRGRQRWNRAHLRCFLRNHSERGGMQVQDAAESVSPAAGEPEVCLDHLERLKFWNLLAEMKNAIKLQQHDTAVGLLPSLLKYQMMTTMQCSDFLMSCSDAGNAKLAKEILRFMDEHGVKKTDRCYSHFLGALSRSGNLEEAWEKLITLAKEPEDDLQVNIHMINSVLNGCSFVSDNGSYYAHKCLDLISELRLEKDYHTYLELIKLAGKVKDLESVKQLWEEHKSKHPLVLNSYRTYIIAVSRSLDLNEAVSMLQEMLDYLSKTLNSSDPIPPAVTEVFNAIVNAAGKAGEYQLAESLFTEMKRMELPVTIMSYNALIRAVVKGRGVDYGLKLVNTMESNDLEPDTCTYSAIVEGYCRNVQLDKAENLLEQMLLAKPNQRPSCYTFNALLQACAATNDQERALRVFQRMKKELVAPHISTYIALFGVFGSVTLPFSGGNQDSHENLTRRLEAIESDMAKTQIPHTKASLSALMQALGTEGMLSALMKRLFNAESYSKELETPFLDARSYNIVMYAFIMNKQVEEAKMLFQRMVTNGVEPDLYTYNVMLLGCSMTQSLPYAYELVETMKKSGISPDVVTYNTLIKVACASGELETALEVIQTMDRVGVEPTTYTFNSVISSACVQGRVDMIEFLIGDMQDRKISPNASTILKVMLTYIHVKRLDDAVRAVRRLSFQMARAEKRDDDNRLQEVMQALIDDNEEQVQDMANSLGRSISQAEPGEAEAQALYGISLSSLVSGLDENDTSRILHRMKSSTTS